MLGSPIEEISPESQSVVREIVTPSTPVEEKLAAIWRDVLKIERVGVNDDFFELGGHPLLATQIILKIHNSFGIQISLQWFLQHPTIAAVADEIGKFQALERKQEETSPRPLFERR
jgi:acyl carrier protein